MLKLIFNKDVNFKKIKMICRATRHLKNYMSHSDFMFVNIEPYKSKECVPKSYQYVTTLTPV